MEESLQAHTLNEVNYYLWATLCAHCGKGPRQILTPLPDANAGETCTVQVRCQNCDAEESLAFTCQYALASSGADAERINPTAQSSRLVDLGQWLSLFYLLVENASRQNDRAEVRRLGYRAALCLEEALKFYGENELPPESAFFHPATRQAFLDHPANFARQRLRDMRAKLPKMDSMKRNVERDERVGKRRWWQFWQGR